MKLAFLSITALLASACASIREPVVSAGEADILRAVFMDKYIFEAPGMNERPAINPVTGFSSQLWATGRTELRELCDSDRPDQCSFVNPQLLPELFRSNATSARLPNDFPLPLLLKSSGEKDITRVVVLSRPAISPDGTEALVAVERHYLHAGWGPDGLLIYLKNEQGRWVVVRHASAWIV